MQKSNMIQSGRPLQFKSFAIFLVLGREQLKGRGSDLLSKNSCKNLANIFAKIHNISPVFRTKPSMPKPRRMQTPAAFSDLNHTKLQ